MKGWLCSSVVEHLPSMCEVMDSVPSTAKEKRRFSFPVTGLTGDRLQGLFIVWDPMASNWSKYFVFPSENLSLGSSCFSPPVNFLQELPSYRSVARRRTNILSRDKQSGTLLKPTDSFSSQLDGGITENLNSQSIRKYALNISEKRRLRLVP